MIKHRAIGYKTVIPINLRFASSRRELCQSVVRTIMDRSSALRRPPSRYR